MKFYLETSKIDGDDDSLKVNVVQGYGKDDPNETLLGHLEVTLNFRDGKLVLDIIAHRSNVLPVIEFNYGKVSEVHRKNLNTGT